MFSRLLDLRKAQVLVYTMGKVGSSAVAAAVPDSHHTHTLYGNAPCPPYYRFKFGWIRRLLRKYFVYPLKRKLIRTNTNLKIVTLYRDCHERNVSMFFQDLQYWITTHTTSKSGYTRRENVDVLADAFESAFNHLYADEWIEKELARFTDINIADLYLGNLSLKIIKRKNLQLFIARVEDLEKIVDSLAEFLDLPSIDLSKQENRGADKWYGPIYRKNRDRLIALSRKRSFKFQRLNGYEET